MWRVGDFARMVNLGGELAIGKLKAAEWIAMNVKRPITREDARVLKHDCESAIGRTLRHGTFLLLLEQRGLTVR